MAPKFFSGSFYKSLPAILNGYLSMVKLLLANGAILQDKIIMEGVNFPIFKYFLKRGANPTAKNDVGDTLLHKECERGNWKHAKYIIQQNKEYVSTKNGKGQTLLQIVCKNCCYRETTKNLKMVKFLIEEQNADPAATCNEGKTALHYATESNNGPSILKYLIKVQKQDIEATDNKGKTALHLACQIGRWPSQKYLIREHPHIIEAKDKKGKTALHYCLQKFEIKRKQDFYSFRPIALILATKTTILKTQENQDSDHIFDWIKQSYNSGMEKCKTDDEAISCLIAGLQSFQKQFTRQIKYMYNPLLPIVGYCKREAKMDKTKTEHNPLLYIVDYCNRVDIGKYMFNQDLCYIEKHFNAEEANLKRKWFLKSYLQFSCENGLLDLTKLLFQERSNRPELFQHLTFDGRFLKYCIRYFQLLKFPHFSFETAYKNKHFDVFKYLLEDEKAKDEADKYLKSLPLDFYEEIGSLEMIQYLIETKKINVEVKNNKGETLLHLACHAGSIEMAKYLIEKQNANVNITDNKGRRVLHSACQSGCSKLVKYFSQKTKQDVNAQDEDGSTALHLACECWNLKVVKFLINDMKSNLHSVDKEGRTPLHVACNTPISKYLVSKGANVLAKDNSGKSPLQIAYHNRETTHFLKAATKR